MTTTASVVSSPLVEILERVHREFAPDTSGTWRPTSRSCAVGTTSFGIAVATVDGEIFDVGDAGSVHDPVDVEAAHLRHGACRPGREAVRPKVGVEPCGEAFNSVSRSRERPAAQSDGQRGGHHRPRWSSGLRRRSGRGGSSTSAASRGAAGGRCRVYESERDTGHRNRAIGHMRELSGCSRGTRRGVDLYFGSARCASTVATCA